MLMSTLTSPHTPHTPHSCLHKDDNFLDLDAVPLFVKSESWIGIGKKYSAIEAMRLSWKHCRKQNGELEEEDEE